MIDLLIIFAILFAMFVGYITGIVDEKAALITKGIPNDKRLVSLSEYRIWNIVFSIAIIMLFLLVMFK